VPHDESRPLKINGSTFKFQSQFSRTVVVALNEAACLYIRGYQLLPCKIRAWRLCFIGVRLRTNLCAGMHGPGKILILQRRAMRTVCFWSRSKAVCVSTPYPRESPFLRNALYTASYHALHTRKHAISKGGRYLNSE
jgi:hypothetical protein